MSQLISQFSQVTHQQLEILNTEAHKKVFVQSDAQRMFAWATLGILLTIQISNQWQRFLISTAY
jgi:hypothetical protein